MYAGPVINTHMRLCDLANGCDWLSHNNPDLERLFGNYDSLKHNFVVPDYLAMIRD